jgi:hypothetical protein
MATTYFLDTNGCCIVILFSLQFLMFCVLRDKIDKDFVTFTLLACFGMWLFDVHSIVFMVLCLECWNVVVVVGFWPSPLL